MGKRKVTLLMIVVELHSGLVDITIKMVHRGDDHLDYWVQVAPGYTVSPCKSGFVQTVQMRGAHCTNVLHRS